MCTAIVLRKKNSYFGRNLDLERGYGEKVLIVPRRFVLKMRCLPSLKNHYAMIGMGAVVSGYPLFFEATNETGFSMAGLNFSGNAEYKPFVGGANNVTPFELIPWILGKAATIEEAMGLLEKINLVNIPFCDELPLSDLHWMLSDKKRSVVVECVKEGIKIYENPFEVLTNNPVFPYHEWNVSNYMGLHSGPLVSQFSPSFLMHNYSLGMGAIGLPGDFSSASRFVRALFVKEHAQCTDAEEACVNQFFHIMNAVAMPKGCVAVGDSYEYTRYTSCCNIDEGIYYFTTYQNLAIRAIGMYDVNLEENKLYSYRVKELL